MASDSGIERLRVKLRSLHHKYKSWRKIAALPEFDGIVPGTLCSIAKGDYEPQDNEIRRILGLSIIVTQYKDPITGRYVGKPKEE